MIRRPPRSTLFPSTTLSRPRLDVCARSRRHHGDGALLGARDAARHWRVDLHDVARLEQREDALRHVGAGGGEIDEADRKSTRLNSSHLVISYAVFCLKKKMK